MRGALDILRLPLPGKGREGRRSGLCISDSKGTRSWMRSDLAAEPSSKRWGRQTGRIGIPSAAVYCRERGGWFHAASYFPEERHGYLNRTAVICGFYNLMALLITTLRGGAVVARQVNKLLDFFTGRCYFIVMREILHTVCTQIAHKERQNLQKSTIKNKKSKQQRQRGKPRRFCCNFRNLSVKKGTYEL